MMINCLILKCKPKMKLALFFYSRLSCIANCYALPRPRGEQSMPDRPDYLDTGHNQELEEPRQRLLEDLSFKRRKTVDGNDSMSTSSRYFFTLSALLPGKISGANQVPSGSVETKIVSVGCETFGPDEPPRNVAKFVVNPQPQHGSTS